MKVKTKYVYNLLRGIRKIYNFKLQISFFTDLPESIFG